MLYSERHPPGSALFPVDRRLDPSSTFDQSAHSNRYSDLNLDTFSTSSELLQLNAHLSTLDPINILAWAIDHLPGVYQLTNFSLTDCAITSLFATLASRRLPSSTPIHLIFTDSLYHFPQTLHLLHQIQERYSPRLSTFYPPGANTINDFEALLGSKLWETDLPTYQFLTKVRHHSSHSLFNDLCSLTSNHLSRS